jgi:tRNA(fMet)-specific endonuclease VapC
VRYLLDTSVCIDLIRRRSPRMLERLQRSTVGDVGLSSITLAELQYGVARSRFPSQNAQALEAFLLPLEIVPFEAEAAAAYGPLRDGLERQGTPIGAMDLLIAAHARSLNVTLVTSNTREFARIEGLNVEDWTVGRRRR